jgi:hypothetical protein
MRIMERFSFFCFAKVVRIKASSSVLLCNSGEAKSERPSVLLYYIGEDKSERSSVSLSYEMRIMERASFFRC